MFAEAVYKRAPGGMDGSPMRKLIAAMENAAISIAVSFSGRRGFRRARIVV